MEEKKKRGRPKKVKLPVEIQELVQKVEEKQSEQVREKIESSEILSNQDFIWDITLQDEIKFFDKELSYELTGYRPINKTRGLDFNPEWFTEARETFKRTGHYCSYRSKTKAYMDFWKEEYRRCRDGMTVNGYTITGL